MLDADTARTTVARVYAEQLGDGRVPDLDEEQRVWFGAVVIGMEIEGDGE